MSFKDLTKRAADALKSKPAAAPAKKLDDETPETKAKRPAPESSAPRQIGE